MKRKSSAPLKEPRMQCPHEIPGQNDDDLPEGWRNAKIEDVILRCQPGFASGNKDVVDGLAQLRMNNIGLEGELNYDLVRTVPKSLARPQHFLQFGDVLVCTTNSGKLVGKCALFDQHDIPYAFSNHLTCLRPDPNVIESSFLRWALWLSWKNGEYEDKCKHWVNQSTLPKDALLDTEFSLPPLSEQRRIVSKLDELLGKVTSARQRLDKLPTLLKRFRQSVLAAVCSGKLTEDWRRENNFDIVQWKESAVIDLLDEPLVNGRSVRNGVDGAPVLRLTCLKNGRIDLSERKIGCWSEAEARRFFVKKGDYFVSRGNGSHSLVGRGGLLIGEPDGVAFPDTLIRIRLMKSRVNPEYFAAIWNSHLIREQIEAAAHTSAGIWKISQGDIEGIQIPVPPLAEQREIVHRVEQLFSFADRIESRLSSARASVEKLTQSILAKAFRGQLVATDAELARTAPKRRRVD